MRSREIWEETKQEALERGAGFEEEGEGEGEGRKGRRAANSLFRAASFAIHFPTAAPSQTWTLRRQAWTTPVKFYESCFIVNDRVIPQTFEEDAEDCP